MYKRDMETVEDIFAKFKKTSAFADALGLKLSAASEMRRRQSIPVRYWPKLVEEARKRGVGKVTFDALVKMHQVPATPDKARVA